MILCPMPRTILVADDDAHIRQLLMFALGKEGLDAIEAADGEAALAIAMAEQPDLIVLDINMPRLDGLEVCRRLRAAGSMPILFLSSRDDEIDRVLGIELGADRLRREAFLTPRGGRTRDGNPSPYASKPARGRSPWHLDPARPAHARH